MLCGHTFFFQGYSICSPGTCSFFPYNKGIFCVGYTTFSLIIYKVKSAMKWTQFLIWMLSLPIAVSPGLMVATGARLGQLTKKDKTRKNPCAADDTMSTS